jgi:hypothetical protein
VGPVRLLSVQREPRILGEVEQVGGDLVDAVTLWHRGDLVGVVAQDVGEGAAVGVAGIGDEVVAVGVGSERDGSAGVLLLDVAEEVG